jgi:hypothetical protein
VVVNRRGRVPVPDPPPPRPHTDEARALLDRLRQLLQHDPWKTDADSQAFLHEAEALIESKRSQDADNENLSPIEN